MVVEIITIGDELLIGQTIDTNSAYLGKHLNLLGHDIFWKSAIADKKESIIQALKLAESRAELIIVTGGLGPTKDDITKYAVCDYFDDHLEFNNEAYENLIRSKAAHGKLILNHLNKKQADLPSKCDVMVNEAGTACGMKYEREGKIFVFFPGVPYEVHYLTEHRLIPFLKDFNQDYFIEHRTVLTYGVPESELSIKLEHFEATLPEGIQLAYLPDFAKVKLRLTAKGKDKNSLQDNMSRNFDVLKMLVKEAIISEDDTEILEKIADSLQFSGKTVATAESCTGGLLANTLTNVAGSSSFFKGATIAYHNDVKVNELDVKKSDIEENGAVSEPVVIQMAKAARIKYQTDFALSISGIAGPSGGSEQKPVGMVWLAVTNGYDTFTKVSHFKGDRLKVKEQSVFAALLLLYTHFLKKEKN